MLATDLGGHFFWMTSRAARTAALLTSSVSVGLGLLMGGRLLKRRVADVRVAHEALSLATITAIVVHVTALLGDSFFHPSIADLTIPFASSYKQPWMAMGIIAGWMMVILGLSFYARARIGQQRWRKLHRFTALAWVLGLAHSLGEGTDAGRTWFLVATAIVAIPAAVLLAGRLSGLQAPKPSPSPSQGVAR